ncbi:phage tail assembly chaperone G [Streptococcus porcinus]
MYQITLLKGGVEKVFEKSFINVEDNLLAIEHQVRQSALYGNEKAILEPKKHRALNEAYLQMFVDMYGGQFTVDDLKAADMSVLDTLNDLYVDALGGKKKEEDGDEKKEV